MNAAGRLRAGAAAVLRYGLVAILVWFGLFKFTDAEARAIAPLIEHSPLMSWLYALTDRTGASRAIGVAEIVTAILLAAGARLRVAGTVGAVLAAATFATTLSFLITTPGMFSRVEWLWVPSGAGGFIVKDAILLGAALKLLAEAIDVSPVASADDGGAAD